MVIPFHCHLAEALNMSRPRTAIVSSSGPPSSLPKHTPQTPRAAHPPTHTLLRIDFGFQTHMSQEEGHWHLAADLTALNGIDRAQALQCWVHHMPHATLLTRLHKKSYAPAHTPHLLYILTFKIPKLASNFRRRAFGVWQLISQPGASRASTVRRRYSAGRATYCIRRAACGARWG